MNEPLADDDPDGALPKEAPMPNSEGNPVEPVELLNNIRVFPEGLFGLDHTAPFSTLAVEAPPVMFMDHVPNAPPPFSVGAYVL